MVFGGCLCPHIHIAQAFAEDNYGEGLGSTTEAAGEGRGVLIVYSYHRPINKADDARVICVSCTPVYGFFFVGCFFSPSITNKFGVRLTMCVGILLGYEGK